mgnify:CR=1 FL=1
MMISMIVTYELVYEIFITFIFNIHYTEVFRYCYFIMSCFCLIASLIFLFLSDSILKPIKVLFLYHFSHNRELRHLYFLINLKQTNFIQNLSNHLSIYLYFIFTEYWVHYFFQIKKKYLVKIVLNKKYTLCRIIF